MRGLIQRVNQAAVTVGGERFRLASDPEAVLAELERARALGIELVAYEAAR